MRFTWDLAKLPDAPPLGSQYHIRAATRDDEENVRTVIHRAFTLDSDWANTLNYMLAMIDSQLPEVFRHRDVPALVVTHGSRIIGASIMVPVEDGESNLLSGPCILIEYRNRGIGSALLHRSLSLLRDAGLSRASGVTKDGVSAAKFVYKKFGSAVVEYEPTETLAR
jgi:predicted N-acetyltransferase YhbS